MKLGQVYRYKRIALGFCQNDVASLAGCSGGMISKFENGEVTDGVYFNAIRNAIDLEFSKLDSIQKRKADILVSAYRILEESDSNKLEASIYSLQITTGHLAADLLKQRTERMTVREER